jgi:hypothetical protein
MTTPVLPPQQPQPDPRGILCFTEPLPEPWASAEDGTQAWDFTDGSWCADWLVERDADGNFVCDYFERPATDTEIALLTALGYVLPADEPLVTRVSFPSELVRRRRWLQLEEQP